MAALSSVSLADIPAPSAVAMEALPELSAAVQGRISTGTQERISYARDMWPKALLWMRQGRSPPPPDLVAWPQNEDEVASVIRIARARGIPVVPFGAGSGVCGGTWPVRGGIALDVKRLESIGTVDALEHTVEVGAGVMGEVLERNLMRQGYTLGHFPSSIYMSTVGGWLAARSAGQLSNKYGKIEDMTLAVRAVTGTGELLVTPPRPHAEPDLLPLLLGSEGTLCVFTGATLRVHRAPAHRTFRGFHFKSVEAGVEAMRLLFRAGLRPSVLRLYDPFDTAIVGSDKPKPPRTPPSLRSRFKADIVPSLMRKITPWTLGRPALMNGATALLRTTLLVLLFEGDEARTEAEDAAARALCLEAGGRDQGESPGRHWFKKRYDVSYKMSAVFDDGAFVDTLEVACTWDRVLDVYHRVRTALGPLAFVLCHFSHAYLEGCSLYFSLVSSASGDAAQEARYDEIWRVGLAAAMDAGATVSHHHGVGLLKAAALQKELGSGARLLRGLKTALDPDGILNPGKLGL